MSKFNWVLLVINVAAVLVVALDLFIWRNV